jgi:hypothetical protein
MNVAWLLLAVMGQAPFTLPPRNLIHSVPARAAMLDNTYTCFDQSTVTIAIALDVPGVTIRALKGFGYELSDADRSTWNAWLSNLDDLQGTNVQCTTDGVVVFITGHAKDRSAIETVVVGWVSGKLAKISP